MPDDETSRRHSSVLVRPLIFSVLFLAIFLGAIRGGISLLSRHSEEGKLVVSDGSLHFGQAWAQKEFRWHLSVENPTNKEVRVREMRSSCRCVSVNPTSFSVPPGSQTEVELVLDLSPRSSDGYREPSWPFQAEIAAIAEGGYLQPSLWSITGRVRNPFDIDAVDLSGTSDYVLGTEYVPRVVRFRSREPLHDVRAFCDPSLGSVKVSESSEAEGKFILEVLPSLQLPEGPVRLEVTLTVRPGGAEAGTQARVSLSLLMRIVHELEAIPSGVSFGPLPVGQEAQQVLLLRSRSGRRVIIESCQPSDEYVTAAIVDEASGSGARCRIFCRATEGGSHTASVRIEAVAPNGGRLPPFVLPVSYVGIPPER